MSKSAKQQNETMIVNDEDYIPNEEEFDEMLKEQSFYDTKRWTDLEINQIYSITSFRAVETSNGESVILTLKDNGDVWCPAHLANKINDKEPPFYIRPLGLKPCKNNKKNKYHAYDLVFPKKATTNYLHRDYA